MQTIRRGQVIVLAFTLAVASLAAACAAVPPPPPVPVATGPLVSVETRGGMCVGGPCAGTVFVERDGSVHQAAKPPNDLGVVPPAALAALEAAIRTTDFASLKSHPFTGQCPTAFDGQEIIFEFETPAGVQRISTCEVDIDLGSPLFVAVSAALAPFIPLDGGPTPP